ncbi:MAG: nucleoid occlusion factor SlmA [Burkholderiales bacterium]|nr:nucleoid occlusion factor SlmA [Burkholderiales bacterium]
MPYAKRVEPGQRKNDILHALAELLQDSKRKHITTKSLAAHLGLSEAALYRHFASKTQMFDALIAYVEGAVLTAVNNTAKEEESGLNQAKIIALNLLDLCNTSPGMVLLMCGDSLTNEDSRLQERINGIFAKLLSSLKQSLRLAVAQNELASDYDANHHADLLMSLIMGQWFMFSKGWSPDHSSAYFGKLVLMSL